MECAVTMRRDLRWGELDGRGLAVRWSRWAQPHADEIRECAGSGKMRDKN